MADDVAVSDLGALVARRTGPIRGLALEMPATNPSLFVALEGVRIGEGQVITISAGSFFVGINFKPTIVYDNGLFSGGRTIQDAATYRNTPGVAKSQLHHTSFYAAPVIIGDGALFTTDRSGFLDAPDYSTVNGGTISGTIRAAHESTVAIGAGVNITSRTGYRYLDGSGAGTMDLQIGVDILALSKATTNIGVRNAATTVLTPSVQTLTAVGNTITPNATVKRLDNTSGGSLTLTSNPHISDGQDGQILVLFNSSANDVVLTDGNGVQLGAATRTIGTRDSLMLMYSTTIGDWIELGFVNN